MRSRSKARARVVQHLYAWEMRGAREGFRDFDSDLAGPSSPTGAEEGNEYTRQLLEIIERELVNIDARIEALSSNWRLSRMTVIDRNVLRLAAAEMLYLDDVPPRVSVQEAIRLADLFGTSESRRFVNGVLDALLHQVESGIVPESL